MLHAPASFPALPPTMIGALFLRLSLLPTCHVMETTSFLGQSCLILENAALRLLVMRSAGPRVLALIPRGGSNLFAELADESLPLPDGRRYRLYGGHRLWHAPEEPDRTYLPEDDPVAIEEVPGGVQISRREDATGIRKTIAVRLVDERSQVLVTHTLTNLGPWPVSCAPWAITQLKTGGVAILPQAQAQTGVLPNRSLAIWPYTDIGSPWLHWGNRYLLVEARMSAPFKIGFPNPRGWLAYWWNGLLFVKRASYDAQAVYPDRGSSSECYADHRCLELETLGPLQLLARGATVSHQETWEVYADIPRPEDEAAVERLVRRLALE